MWNVMEAPRKATGELDLSLIRVLGTVRCLHPVLLLHRRIEVGYSNTSVPRESNQQNRQSVARLAAIRRSATIEKDFF